MRTMKVRRVTVAIWITGAIAVGGFGCGGGSGATAGGTLSGRSGAQGAEQSGVIASVEANPITEATLDHWIAVQASTDYEPVPKGAIPAGVVPDPPAFRACIAFLRSGGPTHEKPSRSRTNGELRAECEANYRQLRTHVLRILISFKWMEAEAKKLALPVSPKRVAAEFARFRGEEYHSIGRYQQYLRRTGQTLADSYLRMQMDISATELRQHFLSEGKPAFVRFLRDFSKEWASRTTCQPSDVVPNCKEYHGSIAPEARI